jgi:phenylacetate-CoA ligase
MISTISLETRFGSRSLLRDNWLCQRVVRDLRGHESMTDAEIGALGAASLHGTLASAISKLPYYGKIPKRFPVSRSVDVLQEYFPVVTKETLLENRDRLYPNRGIPRPWNSLGKTSGTTGTPLCVFRSPKSVLMENAFLRRHWEWGGYEYGSRRATLRGEIIVPLDRTAPPFWFWNRYNNQLLISSRHLRDVYADAIIDELERFSPRMLQAYPSTAFTLAQLMADRNRRLSIPVVFTASEPLYRHQRELIADRFRARVMDMYGMAERVAFAAECQYGSLHINPDYSHVEIVDANGQPTSDEGYIVGTTYHNHSMPLVRYRLSDWTRWRPGRCACARPFPMIEPVTGKLEDRIFGSNGACVSPSVLTFAFKGVQNIRKSQVAQIAPGRWEIRLVPAAAFRADDQHKLIDNLHQLVDPGVCVQVALKDEIPCTESGKFRWVVNEWSRAGERPSSSGWQRSI